MRSNSLIVVKHPLRQHVSLVHLLLYYPEQVGYLCLLSCRGQLEKEGKFEYQEVCVSLKLAFYKKSSHTVPPIITEPKASNTGLPV